MSENTNVDDVLKRKSPWFKKWWVWLIGFTLLANLIAINNPQNNTSQSSYDEYQSSKDPVDMLVKRCASEAGIPANNPNHAITPAEMRALTDCVDRNR